VVDHCGLPIHEIGHMAVDLIQLLVLHAWWNKQDKTGPVGGVGQQGQERAGSEPVRRCKDIEGLRQPVLDPLGIRSAESHDPAGECPEIPRSRDECHEAFYARIWRGVRPDVGCQNRQQGRRAVAAVLHHNRVPPGQDRGLRHHYRVPASELVCQWPDSLPDLPRPLPLLPPGLLHGEVAETETLRR